MLDLSKPVNCYICSKEIPKERIDVLFSYGQTENFQCISCAEQMVKPYRGLFMGNSGAPELKIVAGVGHVSGIYKPEDNFERDENEEDSTEIAE